MKIVDTNISCGIYCIIDLCSGKMYFGLTRQFKTRANQHLNELKKNKHHNLYLQNSYNKHRRFMCFMHEECTVDSLKEREMFWISYYETFKRNNGFNLTMGGEDLGNLTEESKIKKANSRRGKSSSLKGKKQSKEWVEARTLKTKGKKRQYTKEHIEAIKATMAKNKGSRKKGKPVYVTNIKTGVKVKFDSKREVEDFLKIKRDSLIHKFYYGKPRVILSEIVYKDYLIQR